LQKETVLAAIKSMPDDINLKRLFSRLYVLEQIEAGERSLREEPTFSQEEVESRFGREPSGQD